KTIQELADVSSKESLKKEIMRRLNLMFGKGSIRHVYFSNFIIQ
ncbi:MAG TPA: flagellar basal body-associated FliL family protein, partial [Bacteroidetes bacterium]|nr:flagellar basal body-associated FliL family protein [Bacteroidota bacterium]